MTWVEVLLLLSIIGVVGGAVARRRPVGRTLMFVSAAVLAVLLLVFGREFFGDLF